MTTAKSHELTLRDRLSRLTYTHACRLLGPEGARWIREGGSLDVELQDIKFSSEVFRLMLPGAAVEVRLRDDKERRIAFSCDACDSACHHAGAAFALILEEKTSLGLAKPPKERTPVENLSERELVEVALSERLERATKEKMTLRSSEPSRPWTDYTITSHQSGKTYRLALRGEDRGESFCSCPDFRKNTLGTCKHILHALRKLKSKFPAAKRRRKPRRKHITLHIRYGKTAELELLLPDRVDPKIAKLTAPLVGGPIRSLDRLLEILQKLERSGQEVIVYPDAEELIERRLFSRRVSRRMAAIRRDPEGHALRTSLLDVELLPYQLDGIAFAVGAGRAILADDMGLGKTIQAIGTAELLAREASIERVLVICPASVKSQWRSEIHRFCDSDCQLVLGSAAQRATQYGAECFYTICNYEQIPRDILSIEQVSWDLIVLDEGQRIKNWETKTSAVIKSLRSRFALVLTGTPLENRVEEVHSLVEFVDDRRLPPMFRFHNQHRVVDEKGKVLSYKNLDSLRKKLAPILLRRTRAEVLEQLPPRTTEIVRINPTDEQLAMHSSHMSIVSTIVHKAYISEMDLLRLQKALLMCRMAADSTFLVNKQEPSYSSKLAELDSLFENLLGEKERKIVLFSEWTTMLDMIEPLVAKHGGEWVRIDGKVPQKRRQQLVTKFQTDPGCRVFLTTNAGSVGLNLQAANTVINVDLPWNPAILEQRIGRAHRMGQKRPVQVFILVTEETIEERMLLTLAAKSELASAVIDLDSNINEVDFASGMEELKKRLEVLLGRAPEASRDESERHVAQAQLEARRKKLSLAGGKLIGAAFEFLGEALPAESSKPREDVVSKIRQNLLACTTTDEQGQPTLTVTLTDMAAFDRLADAAGILLAAGAPRREKARGASPASQASAGSSSEAGMGSV